MHKLQNEQDGKKQLNDSGGGAGRWENKAEEGLRN
jgi:hypothetical protein